MQTAYIGMGANLASRVGPPDATLATVASRFGSLGRVTARSSLYSTKPVGFADQPRFTNAVVGLETRLEPRPLLDALLDLERAFGRNRAEAFRNGPRTLDLDILLFGNIQRSEPCLQIPHPRLAERAFVLIPLNEIAHGVVVPPHGKTVRQLLDALLERHKRAPYEVELLQSELWHRGPVRAPASPADRGSKAR